jgi:hypothetical protein
LLTACRQGRTCSGTAALPELLRQLHHSFFSHSSAWGGFLLELDPALSTPLQLDAMRLQALIRHWLAAACRMTSCGKSACGYRSGPSSKCNRSSAWKSAPQRHAPEHAAASRARKPTTTALSSAVISRQLARQLGSRQHSECQADGQQYSVLLHAPLAPPGAPPLPWQWPILLLEPDGSRAAELAGQWQSLGHPLEVLDTASAALQRWQQGPLALLVVSDRQSLSVGLELAQSIRQAKPPRHGVAIRPCCWLGPILSR